MPFRMSAPGSPRAKALDVVWKAIIEGWQTSPVTQTSVCSPASYVFLCWHPSFPSPPFRTWSAEDMAEPVLVAG